MHEYKVVEVFGGLSSAWVSPEALERELNEHARDDWELVFQLAPGGRDRLVLTFKRPVEESGPET